MAHFALVLGCDQLESGLGPRTVARLETALLFQQRTGAILIVAAGKAWDFDHALGDLMIEYLRTNECIKFIKLVPEVHSTFGEVKAFATFIQEQNAPELSVISCKFHLWRVRMLLRLFLGIKAVQDVRSVSVANHTVRWSEEYILEPIKLLKALLPRSVQTMAAKILNKCGGRVQYWMAGQ